MSINNQTNLNNPGQLITGQALSVQNGVAIFADAGAPTFSATKGSLYLRTDGSNTSEYAYINTDGATTWTNLVLAQN